MPRIEISLQEIPLDTPFRVEQPGMPIVVLRTEQGITAFEDRCPHAFWPLSEGEIYDGVLECPGHGWEFDVTSGRCLNAPAYCLTPVSVTIEAGMVQLCWSEAAKDEELVSDLVPAD
jgi:nitrite reductase/ring-hydroxylating ferredoxin subunit